MLVLVSHAFFWLPAQQNSPYILNGSAIELSCNCYQLTPDIVWQGGSVWNKNRIDLNNSFNYVFNVYLGSKYLDGADGIVFVLQQVGTSVGSQGEGLGFEGLNPSVGIPIDTYQNYDLGDPPYDHVGIYKNGDLRNYDSNVLAAPVQALVNNPDIEDGQWHTFRIIWDANAKNLSAQIDGVPRVAANVDLVNSIFKNHSLVYWGFSGATGGLSNLQKICTSLNPSYRIPPDSSCAPARITFTDSSTSFGTITNWWWDFGNGSTFNGQHPPPQSYPSPGYYTVKMTIEANNGCSSDTMYNKLTIGSKPAVSFNSSPPFICAGVQAMLTAHSEVEYGTVNEWNWNFNNGNEIQQTTDSVLVKTFPAGNYQIQLVVHTVEGCQSDPFSKNLDATEKPSISLSAQDACYGDPVPLISGSLTPSVPIRQWYWFTGDGMTDSSARIIHYYAQGGAYTVQVFAVNDGGCSSDTMQDIITIYQTHAKAGNDTIVAIGEPLQLTATGGEYYQWSPPDGLSNPEIADPVAILHNDVSYILKAYTVLGCPTYDTIFIKVYKGPDIYVPNAFTPNHDGHNDYFHPVVVGMTRIDQFEVFNRVGQKVFSSQGNGLGWDGTINGSPQPVGTYVWIIRGLDYLGNQHSKKGTVVLIR
jgi:gliding motility-associated-like protein